MGRTPSPAAKATSSSRRNASGDAPQLPALGLCKGCPLGLEIDVSTSWSLEHTFGRAEECFRHFLVLRGCYTHFWRDVSFLDLLPPHAEAGTGLGQTCSHFRRRAP